MRENSVMKKSSFFILLTSVNNSKMHMFPHYRANLFSSKNIYKNL